MDDAASAMLSQVLLVQGAQIRQADYTRIEGRDLKALVADDIDTVVVTFLNENSKSHARQIVRRLKRVRPLAIVADRDSRCTETPRIRGF